jgi:CBS-domain-containing membrane protein
MQAQQVMTGNPRTIPGSETTGKALETMLAHHLHMLPVVDGGGGVLGVVTMFSILAYIVPDYIVSGDLESVSYVPDIGLLQRQYAARAGEPVTAAMDAEPLLVKPDASLLSVAAALISHGKHAYALVADTDKKLLGVISAADILRHLDKGGASVA